MNAEKWAFVAAAVGVEFEKSKGGQKALCGNAQFLQKHCAGMLNVGDALLMAVS